MQAYARETGEIDLDLFIAALAASEGIPVEEADMPFPQVSAPDALGVSEGEAGEG
ncbi:MAG: hypothetical protein HY684_03465 [Chloroflexi bacterium]|nr:hypothetical protein [Chloroflexota bacterium]